jgi:PncC family amidohydrolase
MNDKLQPVLRYLEDNHLKLVTAESCTAGLTASKLAEIPGSGKWLDCAFVTYSSEAKISCLGVRRETIDAFTLTSEEVAREMAEGALRLSRANVALSDTGLAGPSDESSNTPAGTVCFAWSFERGPGLATFSETRRFDGDRNQVREAAAEYVISRIGHYHGRLFAG